MHVYIHICEYCCINRNLICFTATVRTKQPNASEPTLCHRHKGCSKRCSSLSSRSNNPEQQAGIKILEVEEAEEWGTEQGGTADATSCTAHVVQSSQTLPNTCFHLEVQLCSFKGCKNILTRFWKCGLCEVPVNTVRSDT